MIAIVSDPKSLTADPDGLPFSFTQTIVSKPEYVPGCAANRAASQKNRHALNHFVRKDMMELFHDGRNLSDDDM